MGIESYIERVKQARKATQERIARELPRGKELLERSSALSASMGEKVASAVAEGYEASTKKAKDLLESDEAKVLAEKLKDAGENASRVLSNASAKTMDALRKPGAEKSPETNPSDVERDTRLAIGKLSSKDIVGVAGERLAAIGGVATGVAAASTVAGAAGATTLFGSTALAGVFGGIFVTTTPVGWVIGSAALMGAAGYGIAKMIRSGSAQDQLRKEVIQRLTQRLETIEVKKMAPDCKAELTQLIALTVACGAITEDAAGRMVALVDSGTLNPELALKRVKSIAFASGVIATAPA